MRHPRRAFRREELLEAIWGFSFVLRGRPLGVQVAVTAFAPVLAVALGLAWAASQMFITSHDLWVLWVVLVGAGTVGLVGALLLGRRVAEVSASVGEMARRLGVEGPGSTLVPGERRPPGAGPLELAALADQLEETSARLADAQAEAAALERSRRELVSWVSHDLRTPLSGIRAMVEALEDRVVDDPETVVVHAALDATATQAEVWVQDGCGGIPEGDLDLVFELAYRSDVARTPGDGGAGLSLAVARGLVEAHHGDINVRNEGAGCRFTVTLPCPRGEVG
jgi:signal transduction histidine kinase